MTFRNYLVGTIVGVLLIWGPIDHSWPAWLVIRIGYLMLIPLAVWFLLGWIWNSWRPRDKVGFILERIVSGIICIALFTLAILEATSKTHVANTKWIRTRDGMEAIGEEVLLDGPDWGSVILIAAIATLILWFGVIKKVAKSSAS